MNGERQIVFSAPAGVELQNAFLDIRSRQGEKAAKDKIDRVLAELEKLRENPFLGIEVPRNRPAVKNGRITARRGLRLYQADGFLAYYKVSQSDVNIYHIFERGTQYPNISERDLGEE